jgi:hypothetical protein
MSLTQSRIADSLNFSLYDIASTQHTIRSLQYQPQIISRLEASHSLQFAGDRSSPFGSLYHVAAAPLNLSDNKDENSASARGTALESGLQRFGWQLKLAQEKQRYRQPQHKDEAGIRHFVVREETQIRMLDGNA